MLHVTGRGVIIITKMINQTMKKDILKKDSPLKGSPLKLRRGIFALPCVISNLLYYLREHSSYPPGYRQRTASTVKAETHLIPVLGE